MVAIDMLDIVNALSKGICYIKIIRTQSTRIIHMPTTNSAMATTDHMNIIIHALRIHTEIILLGATIHLK